jgi:hypothetical protein
MMYSESAVREILKEKKKVLDALEKKLSDGDETLHEALRKTEPEATATGYRSDQFQERPDWYKKLVDEYETNWLHRLDSECRLVLNIANPFQKGDDGVGDDWYRMERERTEDVIKLMEDRADQFREYRERR